MDKAALRAGKVYLVMTLAGELALFAALVLVAHHAGGLVPERAALVGLDDLTIGLLLFGLAIKAGLVPLHVWLPLAHPAAPVPASAVLSGAMIKVALLGWLRFLPIGETALVEWGLLLIFTGLATLFFAIPIGLVQSNLKVILAYSSVAKMGLMALTLGLILLEPSLAPIGVPAIALYAAHHGLAKGGLFLGVGLRHYWTLQGLVLTGTLALGLSLAGAPLTGGAVAKYGIKPVWVNLDWAWLDAALALGAVAPALLVMRFLWVTWHTQPHPAPGYTLGGAAWSGLLLLVLGYSVVLGGPAAWATNLQPIALALVLALPFALVGWRRPWLLRPAVGRVPPGDLLGLVRPPLAILGYLLRTFAGWSGRLLRAGSRGLGTLVEQVGPPPADPERGLRRWPNAGTAWLAITLLLLVLSVPVLPGLSPMQGAVPVTAPAPSEPGPEAEMRRGTGDLPAPVEAPLPAEGAASAAAPASRVPEVSPEMPLRPAREIPAEAPAQELTATGPGDEGPPAAGIPSSPVTGSTTDVAPEDATVPPPPAESVPEAGTTQARESSAPQAPAQIPSSGGACGPDQTFVFTHPAVPEPLHLEVCEEGPEGLRRLSAPEPTNRLVELVQRHLSDLGHDPGPVDGLMGPRTREAIRSFQLEQGDEPTGAIELLLLERLQGTAAGGGDARSGPER
jgi:hypothetical protein